MSRLASSRIGELSAGALVLVGTGLVWIVGIVGFIALSGGYPYETVCYQQDGEIRRSIDLGGRLTLPYLGLPDEANCQTHSATAILLNWTGIKSYDEPSKVTQQAMAETYLASLVSIVAQNAKREQAIGRTNPSPKAVQAAYEKTRVALGGLEPPPFAAKQANAYVSAFNSLMDAGIELTAAQEAGNRERFNRVLARGRLLMVEYKQSTRALMTTLGAPAGSLPS